MAKRPTPKQLRDCLRRMEYHQRQLYKAMRDAEDKGVLRYDQKNWQGSPFEAHYDLEIKITEKTKDAIAETMRVEMVRGIE